MRSTAKLSAVLLAATLSASEVDPKLLRLIGPDSWVVCGIDFERYRSSSFASLYPPDFVSVAGLNLEPEIRQLILATGDGERRTALIIFRRPLSLPEFQSSSGEVRDITFYRGTPVLAISENETAALLDTSTAVAGDATSVREAIDRWRQVENTSGDMAAKVRRLTGSYDNWIVAVRPLAKLNETPPAALSKYRNDLIQMVEEVRAGIRFGASNEMRVEVVMKTPDDALALAALARWVPGFIQLSGHSSRLESALVDLVENLSIRAEGVTVSLSFSIEEARLQELIRSVQAAEREVLVR